MVDLVVLAGVLRATTKKGRKLFVFPPIFSSRTAPVVRHGSCRIAVTNQTTMCECQPRRQRAEVKHETSQQQQQVQVLRPTTSSSSVDVRR